MTWLMDEWGKMPENIDRGKIDKRSATDARSTIVVVVCGGRRRRQQQQQRQQPQQQELREKRLSFEKNEGLADRVKK